jgi:hypothetical protein
MWQLLADGLPPLSLRTMILGITVHVIALACCARAWRVLRSRYWLGHAIFQFLLVLEAWIGTRHKLTALAPQILGWSFYGHRHYPQLIAAAVMAVVVLALTAFFAVRLRHRGRPAVVALIGAALSLFLYLIAVVSPHSTDAILYQAIGPVMLVAWCWAGAALLVAISATAAAQRASLSARDVPSPKHPPRA